jgi:HK97 gp10 family phage protein
MAETMRIEGLNGVLKMLEKLPRELTASKRGGVVAKAAAKGITVVRKQAQINLRASTNGTGFTAKNIFTKRKLMPAGQKGERYIVGVRYKQYPDTENTYKKKPIRANDIAFMLEYGTSKMSARPWLRPAFDSKKVQAVDVTSQSLLVSIDKIASDMLKDRT